jgi:hypothetical protein
LSPDQLNIPPAKKRKPNRTANAAPTTTAAQSQAASATLAAKQAPADAKKPVAVSSTSFKCDVLECQYHKKGFGSRTALDKHVEENHKVEEVIANPLDFLLESYRSALGVQETNQDKGEVQEPKKKGIAAPEMQKVASKGVATPKLKQDIKIEGTTPGAVGTTPMGRSASRIGAKSASPASNQLRTPQLSAVRGPGSSNLKPTPSTGEKKDTGKPAERATSPVDAVLVEDSWANSTISLEAIRDTFGDFGDDSLPGLGIDPVDEFLNPEMFMQLRSDATPQSTDTAVNTQTSHDSDISKDDVLDINIGGVTDDSWLPADWVNLPGQFEGNLLMNEAWEIGWEAISREEAEMSDDGDMVIDSM